jgi:hypothetical protein
VDSLKKTKTKNSCLAAKRVMLHPIFSVEILCFRVVYLALISGEAANLLGGFIGIIPGFAVDEKPLRQFDKS